MNSNFILNSPDVSFYLNAMRKCGYDNYDALCEFVDNSIEKDVNSTFCDFTIIKGVDGKNIDKLVISDDGNGLEEKHADTFFNMGVSTKDASCYGGYGLGAKTAGLSMGKRITLFTKQTNSPIFKYVFDLDVIAEHKSVGTIKINEENISSEEISLFFDSIKNTDHGTMIVIDKLDSLTCKNIMMFKNTLSNRLSKNYSMIMSKNSNTKISIEGENIKQISYVGGIDKNGNVFEGQLINGVTTSYKGCPITIECYYLPTPYGVMESNDYDIPANQKNCGIYFFRNGRLVGGGLKPNGAITSGTIGGDGYSSRFRVLINYGGEMDAHINLATFNKMVSDSKEFDEEFRTFLHKNINKSYAAFKVLDRERIDANNARKTAESDAEMTKCIKNVINGSRLKISNKQAKNKNNEDESNKERSDVKRNTSGVKNRDRTVSSTRNTSSWFSKYFTSWSMSPYDDFYKVMFINGKYEFIINGNHPCYESFWSTLDREQAINLVVYFCTYEISITTAELEDDETNILLENLEIIKECHNKFLHNFYFKKRVVAPSITVNRQTEMEFVGTV
jgi:hypothetical protein